MNSLGASKLRRVLIVDADDDTRLLYRQALERAPYDVAEASDGRDALTKALAQAPSLVITELRLPFVDGFALCEILRRDPTTADVPILIVTTETRPAEVDRARRLADAVLTKPTLPETLLSEIQRLMMPSTNRQEPSVSVRADAANKLGVRSAEYRRSVLVKAHSRFATAAPSVAPPALTCPSCDRPLSYESSHVGGVSYRQIEQWDYFSCATCGAFQYRERTRTLRRLGTGEQQWASMLRKSRS
jgi:CheY-like chemotaxis protein